MPVAGPGEVILKVLAAGVNNTGINPRLGWYSSSVTHGTTNVKDTEDWQDGGWKDPTPFPLIEGADCCGALAQYVKVPESEVFAADRQPRHARDVSQGHHADWLHRMRRTCSSEPDHLSREGG